MKYMLSVQNSRIAAFASFASMLFGAWDAFHRKNIAELPTAWNILYTLVFPAILQNIESIPITLVCIQSIYRTRVLFPMSHKRDSTARTFSFECWICWLEQYFSIDCVPRVSNSISIETIPRPCVMMISDLCKMNWHMHRLPYQIFVFVKCMHPPSLWNPFYPNCSFHIGPRDFWLCVFARGITLLSRHPSSSRRKPSPTSHSLHCLWVSVAEMPCSRK